METTKVFPPGCKAKKSAGRFGSVVDYVSPTHSSPVVEFVTVKAPESHKNQQGSAGTR